MVYYGTEILMSGKEEEGHGPMRKDFPGGWPGDTVDAFSGRGLSTAQADAQAWMMKLLNYRRQSPALGSGRLLHFIPEDGQYVYFRIHAEQRVMVVLNNNETDKTLDLSRFGEGLGGHSQGIDVMSGQEFRLADSIPMAHKSIRIIELH